MLITRFRYAFSHTPRLNFPDIDALGCIHNRLCVGGSRDWFDNNYSGTSYAANVAGQTYAFWVHAKQGENCGAPSATSFTCSPPAPASPPTCSSATPSATSTTATSGLFRIYAYGVNNATTMLFPTWGDSGGQDDLIWYTGTSAGNGTWYADINLANHKAGNPEFGTFFTHVYVGNSASPYTICAATTWTRSAAPPPSGTLSTNSPCTLANGASTCEVTYQWAATNTPVVCIWRPDTLQLIACGGLNASGAIAGVTQQEMPVQIRAHAAWPDGSNASYLSGVSLSQLNVKAQPIAIACQSPSSMSASPQTLVAGTSSYVTLSAVCIGAGSWVSLAADAPPDPPRGQATVIVGPFLRPGQYDYVYGNGYIVITVTNPVASPTLLEATTFTASCSDKYCIKLTGFNFANNAFVEVRRGTELLGTLVPTLRGRNGDADVLEVTPNTAAMLGAINAEVPAFLVTVVNPGSPSLASDSKQILRSTETIAGTVLSYQAPMVAWINGSLLSGWACRTNIGAIPIRIREGSLFGNTIGTAMANESGSPVVGQACGASGTQYFNFRWPDKYRDGISRRIYVVADVGAVMNAVPNNILIGNSPLTLTLPNVARRAEYVSIQLPAQVIASTSFLVQVTYRNIGSIPWVRNDNYLLGSSNPLNNSTWGIARVSLPNDTVSPGQSTTFSFNVVAPANAGNYNMQWSMLQENVEWFGDLTSNKLINVLPRSTASSNIGPQPTVPNLNSPLPYAVDPPSDPILALPPIN